MTKTQQNNRWQTNHPLKYKAHMTVNNSVRAGHLPRVGTCTCADCNSHRAAHYHHNDYSKPLQVEALCIGCHNARHGS